MTSPSSDLFSELIQGFNPNGNESSVPLLNVTFFLGAGFSKSWDSSYPLGNKLFTFENDEWMRGAQYLEQYLVTHGYDQTGGVSHDLFRDIIYQLGMYDKYPELRPRYIDDGNIKKVESDVRALVWRKLNKLTPEIYLSDESHKMEQNGNFSDSQKDIIKLFCRLKSFGDGSGGVSEGVRVNIMTTNYDCIPELILDSCCAMDDSFMFRTYRGITPWRMSGVDKSVPIHDHWLVDNLIKVNGGVEIFQDSNGFDFNYSKKGLSDVRLNPPQIMLPSNEQDYTQEYFRSIFPKAKRLLQETQVLVVVGYSMPADDALIRFLIRQFAESREDGRRKVLFYVDMSSEVEQVARVHSIFPYSKNPGCLEIVPCSKGFSDWAKEVGDELESDL